MQGFLTILHFFIELRVTNGFEQFLETRPRGNAKLGDIFTSDQHSRLQVVRRPEQQPPLAVRKTINGLAQPLDARVKQCQQISTMRMGQDGLELRPGKSMCLAQSIQIQHQILDVCDLSVR